MLTSSFSLILDAGANSKGLLDTLLLELLLLVIYEGLKSFIDFCLIICLKLLTPIIISESLNSYLKLDISKLIDELWLDCLRKGKLPWLHLRMSYKRSYS